MYPHAHNHDSQFSHCWVRDHDRPVLSLGEPPAFDDTHIFAPCVAREADGFSLWYCGSQAEVARRVFRLGLATSEDGIHFEKRKEGPVFEFGDDRSILTPTLLRTSNGQLLREQGKLRMWFSSTNFPSGDGLHTLHEIESEDGIEWSEPSVAQLDDVYSPTILRDQARYRMWYVDVGHNPWVIRHAYSVNGRDWTNTTYPVLHADQQWESERLFYPTVVKIQSFYVMWYGSYWSAQKNKTAIGFAYSRDGLHWRKHPDNPVLMPDPERPWESHYTTSQSVVPLADGRWRIWYASRKAPPFLNKYFAINTAVTEKPLAP